MIIRLSAILLCLGLLAPSPVSTAKAQALDDVAYVESVSGRAVALVGGLPTLLDMLDTIADRTRIDVLPRAELRICHYHAQRIVTLNGPARATVTTSGVMAESGAEIPPSSETCVRPVVSNFQGGFIARTAGMTTTKVSLRPRIKIINRTKEGIRSIALWDGAQRNIVASFEHNAARPVLSEGQSYVLVVARNDGTESRMMLHASPLEQSRTLIFVVQ